MIELIVVMAIVTVALLLGMLGYSTVVQSTALTTSGNRILDLFSEARQDAVAQNSTVEVRMYHLAGTVSGYGSLQLHWIRANGTTAPASKLVVLSSQVVIDETAVHSTLIASNAQSASDPSDTLLDSRTRLFHFLPDGSTDLSVSAKWFVTLRAAAKSDPANFPTNWVCLELDPSTGRSQLYHP